MPKTEQDKAETVATEPETPPVKLVPRDTRLPSNRALVSAAHKRRLLYVELPAGTQPEELLNPRYWTHHVRTLQPMDRIEVFCEDGTWEGEFRVMFVGTTEVKVSPLSIVHHDQPAVAAEDSPYIVKWVSAARKWGVFRRDNGALIKDNLFPPSAAHAYLQTHLAEMRQ